MKPELNDTLLYIIAVKFVVSEELCNLYLELLLKKLKQQLLTVLTYADLV